MPEPKHTVAQQAQHTTSFADMLRKSTAIPAAVLDEAINESQVTGTGLEKTVLLRAPEAEIEIYRLLASYLGYDFDGLSGRREINDLTNRVPSQTAFKYTIAPLEIRGNTLVIAVCNLDTLNRLDELAALIGTDVSAVISPPTSLKTFINSLYGLGAETVDSLIATTDHNEGPIVQVVEADTYAIDSDLDSAEQASITSFVNKIFVQAINDRASDIHIEPYEQLLRVRFRIDGQLQEIAVPARLKRLESAIISRVKVLANMDIAEKRISQDGQMRLKILKNLIHVRVSVLPTIYGESLVLRLHNRQTQVTNLDQLGMPTTILEKYRQLLDLTQGLIVVCGPTGSGKSTTLYASLNEINQPARKIITVEDPVEYRLEGVTQVQVKESIGVGFNNLLRNIVRHDPDVLMIGEIRDTTTGQIALNAAMTGHLVLSTLHTNDAPTAVTRLLQMGIPPYMVAAGLKVVVAQRLVRVLCTECRQIDDTSTTTTPNTLLQLNNRPVYRAVGCEHCHHTGYRGRTGIYEFFTLTESMQQMVLSSPSPAIMRKAAESDGIMRLCDTGLDSVLAGLTTLEEISRVTRDLPREDDDTRMAGSNS